MKISEIRLHNIKKQITKVGSQAELSRILQRHPSQIGQWLNGTKSIGEKIARDVEEKLKLQHGSLDIDDSLELLESVNDDLFYVPEYDVKLSAGHGCEIISENIIRHIPLLKSELRALGLNEKHLAIFTVDGESMMNSLVNGERVLIDRSQETAIDNRIFAVCVDNTVLIKRLLINPVSNSVMVSSDNDTYKRFDFTANEDTKIIGMAVLTLSRKLF